MSNETEGDTERFAAKSSALVGATCSVADTSTGTPTRTEASSEGTTSIGGTVDVGTTGVDTLVEDTGDASQSVSDPGLVFKRKMTHSARLGKLARAHVVPGWELEVLTKRTQDASHAK